MEQIRRTTKHAVGIQTIEPGESVGTAQPKEIVAPSSAETAEPLTVSVVLPCLNEAESVGLCVTQALSALQRAGISGEVVVIDNGSTDGSAEIARALGAAIVAEARPGYGSALRAGIAAAAGEVVVMADADFTYDLDRTPNLVWPILDGEADLVIGTRRVASRESMPLLHRFLGTPLLTFLIGRATDRNVVTDSQSGFRAFRRDALLGLGLRAAGMEFASEMLIRAVRAGWRIQEIPTEYRARIGKSKLNPLADGWRHLRLIALLAPDLLLVWPGAAALFVGVSLAVWSLVHPTGFSVGSIRWQPVFFSTIAMVLGVQALLAGCVLAYASSVSPGTTKQKFSFVGSQRFLAWCARGGLAVAGTGLAVDAFLFVVWVSGHSSSRALPLAALAQGLLILGVTTASFGLIARLMCMRVEASGEGTASRGLAALFDRAASGSGVGPGGERS